MVESSAEADSTVFLTSRSTFGHENKQKSEESCDADGVDKRNTAIKMNGMSLKLERRMVWCSLGSIKEVQEFTIGCMREGEGAGLVLEMVCMFNVQRKQAG